MAEVWYLEMETKTLENKEPRYRFDFDKCIELFNLSPGRWKCEPDKVPDLRTGNPLIDQVMGYVGVLVRVTQDELEGFGDKRWKPGWYLSPLTPIGAEKVLARKKAEEGFPPD